MSLVLNTNIDSLIAQNSLTASGSQLASALQQLSSGLRVNTAADDAAGYAIAQGMTSQINGLDQAAQNANDGVSLTQTASGALSEVTTDLQTMRDLAVESLNATNSTTDRADLNAQFQQLAADINNVAANTQFNGVNLLNGSFQGADFQIGADAGQVISVSSIASAATNSIGNYYTTTGTGTYSGTNIANGDTATLSITVGSGAAVSTGPITLTGNAATDLASIATAINEVTGSTDGVVATVTGSGISLSSASSDAQAVTIAVTGSTGTLGTTLTAAGTAADSAANLTAQATAQTASATAATAAATAATTAGLTALATAETAAATAATAAATAATAAAAAVGTGTAASTAATAATDAATATTAAAAALAAYVPGSGPTAVTTAVNAAATAAATATNGTPTGATNLAGLTALGIGSGAINAGVYDLGKAGTVTGSLQANANNTAGSVASTDVTTVGNSNLVLISIDSALQQLATSSAQLGAYQNRFSAAITGLNTDSTNLTSAKSAIVDTDYAQATSSLSKAQILQQASTAMVAQANTIPENILTLLQKLP
jgi:flagellin